MDDYYRRLGVRPDADAGEIRSAYRRLSLQHHPDASGRSEHREFLRIQEAYDTLNDPHRREEYDRQMRQARRSPVRRSPAPPSVRRRPRHSMVEELSAVFYPGLFDPHAFGTRRLDPLDLEVCLSADEAAEGGALSLRVPLRIACDWCGGRGRMGPWVCGNCHGEGTVDYPLRAEVEVPPGVSDGEVLVGCMSLGSRGDLPLRLRVRVEA